MALEIILAVRTARARELGELGEDAVVVIENGSRQHKDLVYVWGVGSMEVQLGVDHGRAEIGPKV